LNTRYNTSLVECGAVIQESLILLAEYQKTPDWSEIRRIAYSDNILNKRSSARTKKVLRTFRKRYVDAGELPKIESLSLFVTRDLSYAAKTQSLLPYVTRSDALLSRAMQCLVWPRFASSNSSSNLSKSDVMRFFEQEGATHNEMQRWSPGTVESWIQHFLAVLREFDLMEKSPRTNLKKPIIRKEVFAFFCIWLLSEGISGIEVFDSPVWNDLLLNADEIEYLLLESHEMGWIEYARAGDIISVTSHYESPKEWIYGLG